MGRAEAVYPAQLPGHRLVCNKLGGDGSGKANLVAGPSAVVWGVLYEFERSAWDALDRSEEGYERVLVEVVVAEGVVPAWTYVALRLTLDPIPFEWYKRLLVDGARQHGLPSHYVAGLERISARPDPPRRP